MVFIIVVRCLFDESHFSWLFPILTRALQIAAERDLLRDKVLAAVQNKDSSVSNDETNNNNNNKDTTAASTKTNNTMKRDEDDLLQSVMAERDALRYKVDEYKIREEEYKRREVEYKMREERPRNKLNN